MLSALDSFSEVELKAHGISSINMGGLSWVYSTHVDTQLLLVAADHSDANTEVMRSRLSVIYKMFIEKYDITPEKMVNVMVNQSIFDDFQEEVDMLIRQWKQIEDVINGGAPLMYDLLGVFQQIFNIFHKIIQTNFYRDDYERTIVEVKMILENMRNMPEYINSDELSKISYDEFGWNVINLNPKNLEEELLRRTLVMITLHLNNVLKGKLSKSSRLNAYSKDLFPFIMNKYELLVRMEILEVLLRIFLF